MASTGLARNLFGGRPPGPEARLIEGHCTGALRSGTGEGVGTTRALDPAKPAWRDRYFGSKLSEAQLGSWTCWKDYLGPSLSQVAMAERKTEVFGQFATLHPEAALRGPAANRRVEPRSVGSRGGLRSEQWWMTRIGGDSFGVESVNDSSEAVLRFSEKPSLRSACFRQNILT